MTDNRKLGWIHPDDEFWHCGILRPDGQIDDTNARYGTIQQKRNGEYLCFASGKKARKASDFLSAKQIVESMLK